MQQDHFEEEPYRDPSTRTCRSARFRQHAHGYERPHDIEFVLCHIPARHYAELGPALDNTLEVFGLKDRLKSGGVADSLRLFGRQGWRTSMFIGFIRQVRGRYRLLKRLELTTRTVRFGNRTREELAAATGQSWPLHGIRLATREPRKCLCCLFRIHVHTS